MTLLKIVLPLCLAACAAPGYWSHTEHQDPARFQRDASQCVYESNMATAGAPSYMNLNRQISQDIATGARQGELQRLCMQARGYYWQSGATPVAPRPAQDYVEKRPVAAPATRMLRAQVQEKAIAAKCATAPQPYSGGVYMDIQLMSVQCDDGRTVTYRCTASDCNAID